MPWQAVAVVYPDIELVLTGRYRTSLNGRPESYAQSVYVSNTVPTTRRDRMVIVRRDGGTQAEMRDRPRVTIQVFATTEADATNLAALVMALAPTFADGSPIVSVPIDGRSGPSPVADASGPLRLMNIEFHTRGVPA